MTSKYFASALSGCTVEEAKSLAKILDVQLRATGSGSLSESQAGKLWESMSYLGSNDFAFMLRGFEGVDYPEILRDVCEKMKVKNIAQSDTEAAVLKNEERLIEEVFAGIWEHMSPEEQKLLLKELKLNVRDLSGAPPASVVAAIIASNVGGFATYQLTVIVANVIARGLLGSGLSFAANAAMTKTLGMFLGPIGWIASGSWLAISVAGPNFKKTVPAVIQIAALRQLTRQRERMSSRKFGRFGAYFKGVFQSRKAA